MANTGSAKVIGSLSTPPSGSGNNAKGSEPAWFKQARGYEDDSFPGELYNLHDDLPERLNLFGERPDMVRQMKALLEKYKAMGHNAPAQQGGAIPNE